MIKSNGGIIGPDNVTTGGAFGTASGVFKLGEVTNLIKDSKWPGGGPQGYQVANSCRFNRPSSDSLVRTMGTATNVKKFTISVWAKKNLNALGAALSSIIWSSWTDANNLSYLRFRTDDTIEFYSSSSSSTVISYRTNAQYRDNSAWYHIVVAVDTTQGTSSNRVKIFVNGTQLTSFSVSTEPSLNLELSQLSGEAFNIGRQSTNNDEYLASYLSEFVFIDGTATAVTDFGEFNSQTGIWVPKVVTGLTFGNNGFYLPFTNASALGEDFSGNDNDFTVNNLTSIDQSTDTCSTNFATMNPLDNYYAGSTFSEGNCRVVTGSSPQTWNTSTFGLSSGKWYMEFTIIDDGSGGSTLIGIADRPTVSASEELGGLATTYAYLSSGNFRTNNSNTSNGVSSTDGDIIGVALDLDSAQNTISYYKNNVLIGAAQNITAPVSGSYFIASGVWLDADTGTNDHNFGNPVLAHSSSNTDGNGFGSFEYAPPAGYLSINTKNLAAVLA